MKYFQLNKVSTVSDQGSHVVPHKHAVSGMWPPKSQLKKKVVLKVLTVTLQMD